MKWIRLTIIFFLVMQVMTAYALLKDPTRPSQHRAVVTDNETGRQGVSLTGILTSKHRKTAVINGEYVQVGDEVGKATVVAIKPDYVALKDAKGKFEVHLYQHVRKLINEKVKK